MPRFQPTRREQEGSLQASELGPNIYPVHGMSWAIKVAEPKAEWWEKLFAFRTGPASAYSITCMPANI